MKQLLSITALVVCLYGCQTVPPTAGAPTPAPTVGVEPKAQAAPLLPRDVAKSSFPSVFTIVMRDGQGTEVSQGSGFVVGERLVATNYHVIEGAFTGYGRPVGSDKQYEIVGVVAVDRARDLVLLRMNGLDAQALPLGDLSKVAVGDEIFAIGAPKGLDGTFSDGIVSSIRSQEADAMLQVTAPISPGSSGGPVLNASGEVIGVATSSVAGGQNLNFAVPVTEVQRLLDQKGALRSLQEAATLVPEDYIKYEDADLSIAYPPKWAAKPDIFKDNEFVDVRIGLVRNYENARGELLIAKLTESFTLDEIQRGITGNPNYQVLTVLRGSAGDHESISFVYLAETTTKSIMNIDTYINKESQTFRIAVTCDQPGVPFQVIGKEAQAILTTLRWTE